MQICNQSQCSNQFRPASGTLLNRYIHGAGNDDPLVWYIDAGTSNKRYLLADERGSIVSETDSSGNVVTTHRYGTYGEPINTSTSRFRYTGQILLPGTELYHYKARVYHPKLGRFLQTDPIGYEDGMNWYAYVGNDPVNAKDPSGKTAESFFIQGKKYENFGQALSGAWRDLKSSLDKDIQEVNREAGSFAGEHAAIVSTIAGVLPHPAAQALSAIASIASDIHENSVAASSGASALTGIMLTDIATDAGKKMISGKAQFAIHVTSVLTGAGVTTIQEHNEKKVDQVKEKKK